MTVFLAVLDESAVPYYEVNFKDSPCMIIIGAEADGISREALSLPNAQKIYIPMGKHISISLNAAVAGSIIIAEIIKQRASSTTT
jgi:tRNA G18 (ribose-2'-O)-methylase SpoU